MTKLTKDYVEFYITNVCNLNCDNCNRLNNYYFSGHENWQDYEHLYRAWSDKVDFQEISILGGEPTLHPKLDIWITGIRNLWPNAKLRVITNGTRLQYWYQRGLFDLLAKTDTLLEVNLHNRERYSVVVAEIRSLLDSPAESVESSPGVFWVNAYDRVKDPSWPRCQTHEDFEHLPHDIQRECREVHAIDPPTFFRNTGQLLLQDRRGVRAEIRYYENFRTAPLRYAGHDRFAVYDSEPEAAHEVCLSRNCTHMMQGKMYKCHHVALLPDFEQQFHVDMTEQQQALLSAYQPVSGDQSLDTIRDFLQHLPNAIPQCRLCPSNIDSILLQSSTDKPRIAKRTIPIRPHQGA